MMVFGKSKDDKSQDAQIKALEKAVGDCWAWIQHHEKNMKILVANNNDFIKKNKSQAELNKQYTASINALVEKDKQHDAKDLEHDALIKGIKNMAKAVETVTAEE